ncbi:MAG: hypothetical protein ACKOE6_11815, partial [Flammeovirgaceae bacterium]
MKKKKLIRVAVLGRGAHTIPTYRALLNKLNERVSISVYSEVHIDQKYDANYRVVSYPFHPQLNQLKVIWFL